MVVPYAYLFQYYPPGNDDISKTGRNLCYGLKSWNPRAVQTFADYIITNPPPFLQNYFGPDCLLIPAPRSSIYDPKSLWPTFEICKLLNDLYPSTYSRILLERHTAVLKSSFQTPQNRPTLQRHFETIRANQEIIPDHFSTLVIVDDVITKGSTTAACSLRLNNEYPNHQIRVFAAVSTQRDPIPRIFEPHEGELVINQATFSLTRN